MREGKPGADSDPDPPITDEGEDHRHARVVEAAIFQIADGAQVVGAGMLRGLHDTRVPMIFTFIGYWGIGIGIGAWLAFSAGWQGQGIWTGLAVGLGIVALLMMWRWTVRDRIGLVPTTR